MDIGFKVVGTLLIGGVLINYFMPTIGLLMLGLNKKDEQSNMFWELCGKINRKWYFFNAIINTFLLFCLFWCCILLQNWVFTTISIPYFIILFLLGISNIYKRFYAITDKKKLSIICSVIFYIYNNVYFFLPDKIKLDELMAVIHLVSVVFSFVLLIMPSKNVVQKNDIECLE